MSMYQHMSGSNSGLGTLVLGHFLLLQDAKSQTHLVYFFCCLGTNFSVCVLVCILLAWLGGGCVGPLDLPLYAR